MSRKRTSTRRQPVIQKPSAQTNSTAIAKQYTRNVHLSEKDQATADKQPWCSVVKTHINPDNIRNGFFELDWNTYFIDSLKDSGFGYEDEPDEVIVDRWLRDLAMSILEDEGLNSNRGMGFVNVRRIGDNRAEIG